jgi:hypothetical protein
VALKDRVLEYRRELVVIADEYNSLEATAIHRVRILEQHRDERLNFQNLDSFLHYHTTIKEYIDVRSLETT